VQKKVVEEQARSQAQAAELAQLQDGGRDAAVAEEAGRQLRQLQAENAELARLLSEQKRAAVEGPAADTATATISGVPS